jgi:cell division protease FtsH
MKVNFKSILLLVLVIIAVIAAVSFFNQVNADKTDFTYGDLVQLFEEDRVISCIVDGESVVTVKSYEVTTDKDGKLLKDDQGKFIFATDKDGKLIEKEYVFELNYMFQVEHIHELASNSENVEYYNYLRAEDTPWYMTYLPFIILGILFVVLWIFVMKSAGTSAGGKMGSFSKSRAKVTIADKDSVKFTDVAGAEEEKAELEEVVEFLKNPAKFVKLGARIPRGVLLVGPPGTGKTLLAKAVAGEAGVPFFSISGSDFVEMYVGVGASRVRDLFDSARKTPASIIFIDEIDAVGRHRGAGLGGGHDEREQTLNQLLVEMDGFGTNSGVIVMAATNRPDILDPALLRPGRFDRRVTVNYPDMNGREAILKVHCRNKPLEETVDLHKIAQATIGFTGADLANLMNEAALLAAKKDKALIGMPEIEDSYMKMLLGPQKKTKVRTEKDNKLCAYHEAGHAIASYYCEHTDPVKHITIIPAGNTGGVTLIVPTEDRMGASRNEMLDDIVVDLGGRVAEAIVLDDISTGASGDIQHATRVARNMVTRYGMSDVLGPVLYGNEHSSDEVFLGRDISSGRNYSGKTAATIDDEIRSIIMSSYNKCKAILEEHIDKLHFVASFLIKNEAMDGDQFKACMEMDNPTIEQIEQIAKDRKIASEKENEEAHKKNARNEELERERAQLAEEALRANMLEGKPADNDFDLFTADGPIDTDKDKEEKDN